MFFLKIKNYIENNMKYIVNKELVIIEDKNYYFMNHIF